MKRLAVILIALSILGCTRTVYVPKEVKTIEYRDRIQRDSIYQRDSLRIYEKGDTVFLYKDRYIYRDRYLKDTIVKVDSVSYPVIVKDVQYKKHVPLFYKICLLITIVSIAGFAFKNRKWLLKILKL